MARQPRSTSSKSIEALRHQEATRRYIPTAEYQTLMVKEEQSPIRGRGMNGKTPEQVFLSHLPQPVTPPRKEVAEAA